MGLVTDALHQKERLATALKPDRRGFAGAEDLLFALGQTDERNPVEQAKLLKDFDGDPQLPLATVNNHQIR